MLWIDTDMGFDDMLAIQMIEAAGLDIAGMSLTFGNSPLEQVRENAASARHFFGWSFPIHSGAETSILGAIETPGHVLGPTGILSRGKTLPPAPALPFTQAFSELSHWLAGQSEPAEILALGPLTNIAILVRARPDLLPKIGRLTWMGGGATKGNQTPSAEFNSYADPEAVAIVLSTGIPFHVIDLDLCRQVLVAPEDLVALQAIATPRSEILGDLFGAYIDIALTRGRPSMALYDPVAAAVLVAPDAFTFSPAHLTIELAGNHTRGRTIFDQRPGIAPNAELGMHVDADLVRRLALDTLARAAAI